MADIVTGGLPNVGATIAWIGKEGWGGTRGSPEKLPKAPTIGEWMARYDAAKAAIVNG